MRYALARYAERQREEAYRIYMTDAAYLQGQNKAFSQRYYELINPRTIDRRTGDEIAADVITNMQLEVL